MGSKVVLVLFLTCVCADVIQGSPVFVPRAMETDIQALEEAYNLKDPSLVPKPVFLILLKDINSTLQKYQQMLLLNATLSVYVKMFSSMLAASSAQTESPHLESPHLERPHLERPHVERLRGQVLHLRKHLYQKETTHLDTLLHKLDTIQVDDPVVQRKALNELKEVFQIASEIGSKHRKHKF